jgi:hypothetical protein
MSLKIHKTGEWGHLGTLKCYRIMINNIAQLLPFMSLTNSNPIQSFEHLFKVSQSTLNWVREVTLEIKVVSNHEEQFVLENLGELPQLIPENHSHILGYVTKKCSHYSQTPILRIQGPAQSG